jgi:hypothetical protein
MKRFLVTACVMLFAGFAAAQPFDEKLCTTVTFSGAPHAEGCITYHDLQLLDLQFIRAAAASQVGALGKIKQTADGPFKVTLAETTTDNGKTPAAVVTNDGGTYSVDLNGLTKIMRAQHKSADSLLKAGEGSGKAGKKKAWGKDDPQKAGGKDDAPKK